LKTEGQPGNPLYATKQTAIQRKNYGAFSASKQFRKLSVLLRIMNIKEVPALHKIDHYTTIFIIIIINP